MPAVNPNPVATTFLAGSGYDSFHPRRWNPNIFPNLDKNASTATQQAQWLSDLTAYCTGTLFPHAAAIGSAVILFWDGFSGQEFAETAYNGDPSYYPPEVPQSSKRAITALCAAHGFKAGECIRPTVLDQVAKTQLYDADPQALYNAKVAASIADGCSAWWFDSSLFGTVGQTPLQANQFPPHAGIAAMAAAHPDCEFYMEWGAGQYADVPNVWIFHDPSGTPGTVGYNPNGGYLPSDVADDPAWDARGIYYDDERVIPSDPTQAAALAASFARGARLFLYAGANFDMTGGGFFTDAQRAGLYALWLANYPNAGNSSSGSSMARTVTFTVDLTQPDLEGTAGCTVLDTGLAALVARTTAGISESPEFPGIYAVTVSIPDTACVVVVDDGIGGNRVSKEFEASGTSGDVDATPATRKLRFVYEIGDPEVLTDLDSPPIFRDKLGTYGVKRADTGTSIISAASATPMTRVSTGVYEYDLGSSYNGVPLAYAVEFTYEGVTDWKTGVELGDESDWEPTRGQLETEYGSDDVTTYADLNSNLTADEITAKIDRSLDFAIAFINDHARASGFKVPIVPLEGETIPADVLNSIALCLAIWRLYRGRGKREGDKLGDAFQADYDWAVAELDRLLQTLPAQADETPDDNMGGLASLSPSGAGLNDTCGTTCACLNYLGEPVLTP